jgi:hypothetical protein
VLTLLVGCGGSSHQPAATSAASPQVTASPSTPATSSAASSAAAGSAALVSPPTAASSSAPASPATSISIPPNLCAATDTAQNTADAYLGALSAGQESQALACVLPGTVPAATTHSLLATEKGTAVYLPRAGADGPTVFGYTGNGKSVDVTVTREADGKTWVTGVSVTPS